MEILISIAGITSILGFLIVLGMLIILKVELMSLSDKVEKALDALSEIKFTLERLLDGIAELVPEAQEEDLFNDLAREDTKEEIEVGKKKKSRK